MAFTCYSYPRLYIICYFKGIILRKCSSVSCPLFPKFMRYCFICIIILAHISDIAVGAIQCLTIIYSYDYKRNIIFIDVEGQDIVKVEQFFIKNVTYVSFFLLKFQISFTG